VFSDVPQGSGGDIQVTTPLSGDSVRGCSCLHSYPGRFTFRVPLIKSPRLCTGYFSYFCDQIADRKPLNGGQTYFASQFECTLLSGGEGRVELMVEGASSNDSSHPDREVKRHEWSFSNVHHKQVSPFRQCAGIPVQAAISYHQLFPPKNNQGQIEEMKATYTCVETYYILRKKKSGTQWILQQVSYLQAYSRGLHFSKAETGPTEEQFSTSLYSSKNDQLEENLADANACHVELRGQLEEVGFSFLPGKGSVAVQGLNLSEQRRNNSPDESQTDGRP
ncbi:hypothetical protein STEG23_012059, partial [Scotinomys teguina]